MLTFKEVFLYLNIKWFCRDVGHCDANDQVCILTAKDIQKGIKIARGIDAQISLCVSTIVTIVDGIT